MSYCVENLIAITCFVGEESRIQNGQGHLAGRNWRVGLQGFPDGPVFRIYLAVQDTGLIQEKSYALKQQITRPAAEPVPRARAVCCCNRRSRAERKPVCNSAAATRKPVQQ